jgi:GNAT superfamily N-acetyltransferase
MSDAAGDAGHAGGEMLDAGQVFETDEVLESGWLAETPVHDSLARRFVVGFAEWVEASGMAAGHAVLRTADVVAVDEHSPQLLLNTAILLRPVTDERAGMILADLAGFYGSGTGGPFCVFCPWPTAIPDFTVGGFPPLMLRMPGEDTPAPPDGLDLVEVTTPELLAEYARVLVEGFPLDELQGPDAPPALQPSTLDLANMRMFVGLVDGRAVCGASSIIAHGVNHVEWVATVPDARGRGFGAAVTDAATLADATVPAMLIATDMGRRVYERMGFVTLDRWTFLFRDR